MSEVCTQLCEIGGSLGEVLALIVAVGWGALKTWQTRKLREQVRVLSERPAPQQVTVSLEPPPFATRNARENSEPPHDDSDR